MAVRFDAAADRLLRTASLPNANSAYSILGWYYLVSDLGAFGTIFSINDNAGSNLDAIFVNTDGTTLILSVAQSGSAANPTGTNLSVATWYHIALVRTSSTNAVVYVNGVQDIQDTTSVGSRTQPNSRMEVGGLLSANLYRTDARVAHLKVYDVGLTAAEVVNEMRQARLRKTTGINLWTPNMAGSGERARDYSGNARNWTESGTLTDEDGPPVPWGGGRVKLFLPSGAGLSAVGQEFDSEWHTRAAVGAQKASDWHTRAAVGASKASDWHVLTTVGQETVADWMVRAAVGQEVDSEWNTISHVGQEVDSDWHVRGAVGQEVDSDWSVFTAVGQEVDIDWHVYALVNQDLVSEWNVASALAAVGQQVDIDWHVRAAPGASVDIDWHQRAAVGRSRQALWHAYNVAGQEFDAAWHQRAAPGKSVELAWNTLRNTQVVARRIRCAFCYGRERRCAVCGGKGFSWTYETVPA